MGDPVTDMLPGANRQWFTTQGGVLGQRALETAVAWATVDAPLITFEDINRGLWPESIQIRNGTVFSYAMNNYWYTDAPAQQGGQFTFRYALTSGPEVSTRPSDDAGQRAALAIHLPFATTTWDGTRRLPTKEAAFSAHLLQE